MSENTSKKCAKQYAFYYERNLALDEPRRALAAAHWPASEVKYHQDSEQFQALLRSNKKEDKDMVTFILNFLCLFQQLDGMVIENLFDNFIHELSKYKEIRDFFVVQQNNELVHSQSYGDQMNACIKSEKERNELVEADVSKYPAVNKIMRWTQQWFDTSIPIEERIIAFAAIEGIVFTAGFVSIYRLKELNLFPGICKANEFISKDEGMHTKAAVLYFKHICKMEGTGVSQERVHEIVRSATELSCEFAQDAIQPNLIGLRLEDLEMYMRLCGNTLCMDLGYDTIYSPSEARCVFEWMSKIVMLNISNFFETSVSEYQTVGDEQEELGGVIDDEDF